MSFSTVVCLGTRGIRTIGKHRALTVAVLALAMSVPVLPSHAQTDAQRTAKKKPSPEYPALARQMHVHGVVKLEVTIGAEGKVKSTRVIGGHPLLLEAAQRAAMAWEFEAAPKATVQVIEFKFEPVA